jgi:predicted nucleic acid-binding protein
LTRIVILMSALLVFSGCIFGGHEFEPVVPTANKKIAVIPFMEQDRYYTESAAGNEIAELVVQLLLKNATDMKLVDWRKAQDLILDENPGDIAWDEVAKKLGADYVVTGNIQLLRARDPKRDVNFCKGEMVMQVTVWTPENTMAICETVTAKYPSGRYNAPVVLPFDMEEDEVLGRLKAEAGLKIARFFYPYTPAED